MNPEILSTEQRAEIAEDCEKALAHLKRWGWCTGDLRNFDGELCAIGALFAARMNLGEAEMRYVDEDAYVEISHCLTGQAVADYIVDLDPERKRHEYAETIYSFNDHLENPESLYDVLRDVAAKYRPDAYRSAPAGG